MPSTYTSSLRLVKQATGENSETWGAIFNQQFADLIDTAIAGYTSIALADADKTLTAANGSSDEARAMSLNFTGALTADRAITIPTFAKLYFIKNSTTGDHSITIKTSGNPGVEVKNGASAALVCNGTLVLDAFTQIASTATKDGFSVGYLEIPQNSKSADYTCVLADSGKHIYHPVADSTQRTWTIPANASVEYPIGTALTFLVDVGAGNIILEITSDTLVHAPTGSTGTRTLTAPASATAVKVAATRWIISGSGIS